MWMQAHDSKLQATHRSNAKNIPEHEGAATTVNAREGGVSGLVGSGGGTVG